MDKKLAEAKKALDKIINKGRVHLYKPIHIAEILYHSRKNFGFADFFERYLD